MARPEQNTEELPAALGLQIALPWTFGLVAIDYLKGSFSS